MSAISQTAANFVKTTVGSWKYVITFNAGFFGWMVVNHLMGGGFDPYPYILLNLVLSYLAGVTGPLIMVSQNQQEIIQVKMQEAMLHLLESNQLLLRDAAKDLDMVIQRLDE